MHLALSEVTIATVLTAPHPSAKQQLAASELRRGLFQLVSAIPTRVAELPGPTPIASELCVVLLAGTDSQETYAISTSETAGLLPRVRYVVPASKRCYMACSSCSSVKAPCSASMVQHSEPGFSRGIEPGINLVIKGIEALVVEHHGSGR